MADLSWCFQRCRRSRRLQRNCIQLGFQERPAESFVMSMNTLIQSYRDNAELHGKFTLLGDSRKANRAYNDLQNTLNELVRTGSDNLLFSLYEDKDLNVQLWAAAHTLELDERRAIDKLQEIAELDAPLVSMGARYTIKGWKEGELRVRRADQ